MNKFKWDDDVIDALSFLLNKSYGDIIQSLNNNEYTQLSIKALKNFKSDHLQQLLVSTIAGNEPVNYSEIEILQNCLEDVEEKLISMRGIPAKREEVRELEEIAIDLKQQINSLTK